jgi:hypothetical protein
MYLILLAQDVLGLSALQTGIRLIPFGGFGSSHLPPSQQALSSSLRRMGANELLFPGWRRFHRDRVRQYLSPLVQRKDSRRGRVDRRLDRGHSNGDHHSNQQFLGRTSPPFLRLVSARCLPLMLTLSRCSLARCWERFLARWCITRWLSH